MAEPTFEPTTTSTVQYDAGNISISSLIMIICAVLLFAFCCIRFWASPESEDVIHMGANRSAEKLEGKMQTMQTVFPS